MTTLALVLAVVLVTVVVHELGHLGVARYCGWRFTGVQVRWWGVGVGTVTDDLRDLWKVALAGPAASAALALVCFTLEPAHPVFWLGAWLNVFAVLVNLLPLPVADGGHILRGLRR